MKLTQRIIDHVTQNPGLTATQVAHALSEAPATVSGILCRLCKAQNGLSRSENAKGTWTYRRS